jgi:hypothetical protein
VTVITHAAGPATASTAPTTIASTSKSPASPETALFCPNAAVRARLTGAEPAEGASLPPPAEDPRGRHDRVGPGEASRR